MPVNAEEKWFALCVDALEARQAGADLAPLRVRYNELANDFNVNPTGDYSSENHDAEESVARGLVQLGWDGLEAFCGRLERGSLEMGPDCYSSWTLCQLIVGGIWAEKDGRDDVAARCRAIAGVYFVDMLLGAVDFVPDSFVMETGPEGDVRTEFAVPVSGPIAPYPVVVGNRGVFNASPGWAAQLVAAQLLHLALDWPGRKATERALDVHRAEPVPYSPAPVGYVLLGAGKPRDQGGYDSTLPAHWFGFVNEGERAAVRENPWGDVALGIYSQIASTTPAYPRSGKTWLRLSPSAVAVVLGDDNEETTDDRTSTKPAIMAAVTGPHDHEQLLLISPVPYEGSTHVRARTLWPQSSLEVEWEVGDVPADEEDFEVGQWLRELDLREDFTGARIAEWYDPRKLTIEDGNGEPPPPEGDMTRWKGSKHLAELLAFVDQKLRLPDPWTPEQFQDSEQYQDLFEELAMDLNWPLVSVPD